MRQATAILSCALLLSAVVGGCGSDAANDIIRDSNRTNIQRLTNLYLRYQMDNKWRGPANEKAFREFIPTLHPNTLELIGVKPDDLDSLFKSERDSEPFQITYGLRGSMQGTDNPVVFEKTGVGGVRQVGFTSLAIREISNDSELAELKKNAEMERKAADSSVPRGVAGR